MVPPGGHTCPLPGGPGSHFSPAGRFLGFPLHGAQMDQSIRCEQGQKGGVLKVKEVALRGSRGPEGASFSELWPERGWAWGAEGKAGPGRSIYPGVKTQGSGQGAAPPSTRWGAARRPVHHLRFVGTPPLQEGVTKEAALL